MITPITNKIVYTELEKYAQIIPGELMAALKLSAQAKGVSLDMEVSLRLMASMIETETAASQNSLEHILQQEFSERDAVAECKRKRADNLYLYEMEKLRLYLHFETKLPRHFKEQFSVINVKEVTKIIRAELKRDNKAKE